mgnify:CR=1 FL=1|tara:strand:- start:321 stop:614 length:294 start_codon:yes stop_codon:yes gene_type:complete
MSENSKSTDTIYIGNGVEKFDGNLVEAFVCLSRIPQEFRKQIKNNKTGIMETWAPIKVQKKRETDEYGKTHSVQVNTFVPEPQTKEEVSVDDSPLDF